MTGLDLTLIATAAITFVYLGYRGVQQWRAGRRRRMDEVLAAAREELRSDRLETRLMAVFSLEEIAKKSPAGYREAATILSAFLRESGCRCPGGRSPSPRTAAHRGRPSLGPDVQRALTVLARCRPAAGASTEPEVALDLSGAGLCRAGLPAAPLSGAELRDACFAGAELWKADLREADLSGASLADANLSGADLDGATLTGTKLGGANLEYATARGADLTGADLARVDLTFARIEGADLTDATGLTDAQIESAYTDAGTKLPTPVG